MAFLGNGGGGGGGHQHQQPPHSGGGAMGNGNGMGNGGGMGNGAGMMCGAGGQPPMTHGQAALLNQAVQNGIANNLAVLQVGVPGAVTSCSILINLQLGKMSREVACVDGTQAGKNVNSTLNSIHPDSFFR